MLSDKPLFSDPYPVYKEIRQNRPIFQDENGTWHFTRYDDVKLLLSDHRFLRSPPKNSGYVDQDKIPTLLDDVIGKWSLFNDPPEHSRLREMLSIMINPRFIKETKKTIDSVAESLAASLLSHSSVDFMPNFAYPLPVQVINTLLGTSLDKTTLRRWSLTVVSAMDRGSPADFASVNPLMLEIKNYFTDLILTKEQQPANDWVSDLVNLKNTYDLSLDDMVSNCIFLLLAGHETVQLTLGLGLMSLLKNPKQAQLLQNNPDLIPSAVEEILRYESALSKVSRWTSEPIVIGDITIPENQLIVGMINAANRDPEKFTHPDEFDITRSNNRHLAFGYGIHTCLGALLARFELQIAFQKLAPHLHKFSLMEDQIEWANLSALRYVLKLTIRIKNT